MSESVPEPDAHTLALCGITASIGPADWERLRAELEGARTTGVPRGDVTETLLQATLFFGFPRTVSAFGVLAETWPDADAEPGAAVPPERRRADGTALFDAIYDRNAPDVHAMLAGYHAEFHDFVIESAYGRILARPGLSPRVRELCAVAALAVLDQIPQLVAHARGARRFGASDELLESVMRRELAPDDVATHMRRITRG